MRNPCESRLAPIPEEHFEQAVPRGVEIARCLGGRQSTLEIVLVLAGGLAAPILTLFAAGLLWQLLYLGTVEFPSI